MVGYPTLRSMLHRRTDAVQWGPNESEDGTRAFTALFGVAGRFVAVAAFVAVVALLFIVMSPALRKSEANSTPSENTGSLTTALPPSSQAENGAKPALAEFQGLLPSIPASKPATPEQPPQLLQQFLEWRQKADSTEKSQ